MAGSKIDDINTTEIKCEDLGKIANNPSEQVHNTSLTPIVIIPADGGLSTSDASLTTATTPVLFFLPPVFSILPMLIHSALLWLAQLL